MKKLILTCFIMLAVSVSVSAQDIAINGFVQGNYSGNLSGPNPDGKDFKWTEEKVQLKASVNIKDLYLLLKTDLSYDHIDKDPDLEIREGYSDYMSDSWDLRLGRQVITWGLGDLIFINDVFPKDYEAFFFGRPLEYMKIGSDAVKIGMYLAFVSAELVIIPFFEPNNFPQESRFHMYDPMPAVTDREEDGPSTTLGNTEIALRLYRDIAGFDAALYFYRGFFRQQSMLPDDLLMPSKLTLVYPELSVYGASIQGNALDGVISLEAGFYDSREDRNGKDPMIPNQSSRYLAGYQKQLWEDFTAGLQYYVLYMHDYKQYEEHLPAGFPQEKEFQDIFTLRLTHLFLHQTLKFSFFAFRSFSDGDYLLIPEVKYKFTDSIWASLGANIFGGGEEWDQFGNLDENDNLYMQVRYEF